MTEAALVEKTSLPSNNNNNNNNETKYNFYFVEPFLIPAAETASFNKVKLSIIPSNTYFADCDGE